MEKCCLDKCHPTNPCSIIVATVCQYLVILETVNYCSRWQVVLNIILVALGQEIEDKIIFFKECVKSGMWKKCLNDNVVTQTLRGHSLSIVNPPD